MKNNMDQGDADLSVLRTPIPTSIIGFMGVMKAFGEGTAEMRRVLEKECDIIYECKVCRNIFRDVANLMTHKRVYCKAAFNSKRDFHFPDNGFIDQNISSIIEQENRTLNIESKREKEPLLPVKDLGGLVHKMRMKQVLTGNMKPSDYYELVSSKVTLEDVMQKNHLLHLEEIPQSTVAVYQTVKIDSGSESTGLSAEPMKREVDEVHKLTAKNDIVVGPDGRALKVSEFRDTVTKDDFEIESLEELLMLCHYNEDEETKQHECAICEARFDTEKTLVLHIQLKHVSSTKVYQCPSCSQTFLQAALVIKHLSNDHKKSTKKIRSMRETIHKRHMRIDEVQVKGPSRELNRLQTERERIEAENNKAYLDNVANFDNSNQSMCTYCNKIFERKAVLTSHMVNCRSKYEKTLMGTGGVIPTVAPTTTGAKRGPKPNSSNQKENGTKDKEQLMVDENSSSTVISSDGGSNDGATTTAAAAVVEFGGDNSNGSTGGGAGNAEATSVSTVNKKRKLGNGEGAGRKHGGAAAKKTKRNETGEDQQSHSKVSELMEKEIWSSAVSNEDDSYFSFDDKAPEDARDETYKRRHPCKTCNKSFSTSSNLKRHNVMFHYFQSRYQCRLCSYRSMKKNEAMAHLREEHQLDKEEHEMKLFLEQEKKEVSSSEVLDLDFDDGSSNQDRANSSTGRDNSRTNSPVSNVTATATGTTNHLTATVSTPPPSISNNNTNQNSSSSNSSGTTATSNGIVSGTPSSAETSVLPRKRGRPKGSFKKKQVKEIPTPPDRGLRGDAQRDALNTSELSEFLEFKKNSSIIPIPPLPPQVDNNSSSSSASSRPIRNRTKPKDKDFVYDLSSFKGDFIYEDDAMDTALNESLLTATSTTNSNSGSATTVTIATTATDVPAPPPPPPIISEIPVKISKKRRSLTEKPVNGTEDAASSLAERKRGIRRAKLKLRREGEKRKDGGGGERRSSSEPEGHKLSLAVAATATTNAASTLKPKVNSHLVNWGKNVIIPTRIVEHRHSASDRQKSSGGVAQLKREETRRNSIEIMTKGGAAGGGGGSVCGVGIGGGGGLVNLKENNRPLSGSGSPLGMIENIMETRAPVRDEELLKDFSRITEEALPVRRHFVATETAGGGGAVSPGDHHILLNGRSLEEIIMLSSAGAAAATGTGTVQVIPAAVEMTTIVALDNAAGGAEPVI